MKDSRDYSTISHRSQLMPTLFPSLPSLWFNMAEVLGETTGLAKLGFICSPLAHCVPTTWWARHYLQDLESHQVYIQWGKVIPSEKNGVLLERGNGCWVAVKLKCLPQRVGFKFIHTGHQSLHPLSHEGSLVWAVFSTSGDFVPLPPETFSIVWRYFWSLHLGRGAIGIQWAAARDAENPTVHGKDSPPRKKNYSAQRPAGPSLRNSGIIKNSELRWCTMGLRTFNNSSWWKYRLHIEK